MENITRDDIADYIHQYFGLSKKDCAEIVNDMIDEFIQNLILDKKIKIHNFGTFILKEKKERVGRNPKTKEEYMISSRNVVKFTLSKKVLKTLNRKILLPNERKEI